MTKSKYKRYTSSYRPEEEWRQTYLDLKYIEAFFVAKDECKKTGLPVSIKGYGGWKVSTIKREDIEENFVPNKR